jgi:hypothetical protein
MGFGTTINEVDPPVATAIGRARQRRADLLRCRGAVENVQTLFTIC